MTIEELEKRVKALEGQVVELKAAQVAGTLELDKASPQWWLATAGRFKDDPVFAEIVRLGREYRESLNPGRKKRPTGKPGGPRKKATRAHR
jgi:hypothetical protein